LVSLTLFGGNSVVFFVSLTKQAGIGMQRYQDLSQTVWIIHNSVNS
jgi:hypothetical protein